MDKIVYEAISKTFPNAVAPAVNAVSLGVPEGRLVVFLGPSGCGKTTLLKMTNRLIEPSSGAILLDGVDIRQPAVTELRRRMGYVIQQVGLFPHMTVAQNVAVVPDLLGWARQRTDARVDELLEMINLPPGEYRQRYPAQLSGGQQQRVGLARALAADPEVLLMDEPFGAIDAITRASLQDEILRLQMRLRKTVLFVTHDVEEALRLADAIAVLRAGELVQFGTPCELLTRPENDFVRALLGADDRVRALGLLHAADFMRPLSKRPPGEPALAAESAGRAGRQRIHARTDLRQALSLLLEPGIERLEVVAGDYPAGDNPAGDPQAGERVIGLLGLDEIRAAACGPGQLELGELDPEDRGG